MGSECLGAETLLQLLKNYARNAGVKAAITVGMPVYVSKCIESFLHSLNGHKR